MASDLVRFSVAVPEAMLEEFDAYAARRGGWANRSEVIRDLIREQLVEDDLTSPEAEVVGSVTMVYGHHTPGLSERLDEIQHDYIGQVVSTMHVHLDHDNCLEVLAVRGPSAQIHELADRLLGTKGVRHGKLVCVATESTIAMSCDHEHCHEAGHDHPHPHGHPHPHHA